MTVDGLLAFLLAIAIPFLLASAGGILAVRTLGESAAKKEKWAWISIFLMLLVFGIGLGVVQQVRITTQQHLEESNAAAEKLRNEGNVKYTQGQLDSINKVLAQVVNANGLNGVQAALLKGALNASSRPSDGGSAIQRMSNSQLKAKIMEFTKAMREEAYKFGRTQEEETLENRRTMNSLSLEKRPQESENQIKTMMAEGRQFTERIGTIYFVDATTYKDELIRRIGPQTPEIPQQFITIWVTLHHDFFSPTEVIGSAEYLEYLTKKLPK